jgi:hypothetical protein
MSTTDGGSSPTPEVERYVLAANLKPGASAAAERLLAAGPPFDPRDAGLAAHEAYVSDDTIFLVFEGEAAHTKALRLANEHLAEVTRWQDLVTDLPTVVPAVPTDARRIYEWRDRGGT